MNKEQNKLPTAIIVVGIVILLVCLFLEQGCAKNISDVIKNPKDNSDLISLIGNTSNAIMAIVSLLNLVLIIYFYFRDKSIRAQEEKSKDKVYWFRNVILERNLNSMDKFFCSNIAIVDKCKEINMKKGSLSLKNYCDLIKEQIGYYTDRRVELRYSLVDLIKVIDFNLGQDLEKLLGQFEEEFTRYLGRTSISEDEHYNYDKCKSMVCGHREKLLTKIYIYESKLH